MHNKQQENLQHGTASIPALGVEHCHLYLHKIRPYAANLSQINDFDIFASLTLTSIFDLLTSKMLRNDRGTVEEQFEVNRTILRDGRTEPHARVEPQNSIRPPVVIWNGKELICC